MSVDSAWHLLVFLAPELPCQVPHAPRWVCFMVAPNIVLVTPLSGCLLDHSAGIVVDCRFHEIDLRDKPLQMFAYQKPPQITACFLQGVSTNTYSIKATVTTFMVSDI